MAAAKTLIPRQESALAEAFKRSLIEERWKNPNEAFYSIWPHSKARGFFWFYLMQGFGNKPKICVIITRIGLKHKINGLDIEGKCIEHFENKFETGMDCWYFENGKIKDLFHNKGVTQQLKDKIISESNSGYKIILDKKFPRQRLRILKYNKEIAKFQSISSAFKEEFRGIPHLPASIAFSKNKDAIGAVCEYFQFPMATKQCDFFSRFKGHFMGKKLQGPMWSERLNSFLAYAPWKYLLITFKKRYARLSFNWYYHKKYNFYYPTNFSFDYNKKVYYLFDFKYHYFSKLGGRPYLDWRGTTKWIKLEGKGPNSVSMKLLAKIIAKKVYKFKALKSEGIYWQFILNLKNFEFKIGKKRIKLKDLGKYSAYAEHSYLSKILGKRKRRMI